MYCIVILLNRYIVKTVGLFNMYTLIEIYVYYLQSNAHEFLVGCQLVMQKCAVGIDINMYVVVIKKKLFDVWNGCFSGLESYNQFAYKLDSKYFDSRRMKWLWNIQWIFFLEKLTPTINYSLYLIYFLVITLTESRF